MYKCMRHPGSSRAVGPEDVCPNPSEVCVDPPAASVVFALMMLKTSLSFANLVPAHTGSGCESLEIFQPFHPS